MTLTTGTRLGAYEIVSSLGAGGMGEVYRARDTRLGRDVAIKLLPELFAGDPDRLGRFAREAQLLASFNHPHIAQIYGFEEGQGDHRSFLVMELVEGQTLEELIRAKGRGPTADGHSAPAAAASGGGAPRALQIDGALKIARQLAAALDAAHEKGIIHRDLKPANIKITEDGTVKVLDFGLAKALQPNASNATAAATMTSPAMTQMGVILGTAAYMSPEQARGKIVDKRADIWAFGCVLYEMLTGRQAFAGETVTDILGAIVHKEPDWTALPPALPAPVAHLLGRCLQKDVKARLRDIGDAQVVLGDIGTTSSQTTFGTIAQVPLPAARHGRMSFRAIWLAAGALLGLLAGWALFRGDAPTAGRTVRFSLTLPGAETVTAVAITRAGDQLVLESDRLYVRAISDEARRPIPGTEGARNLFLSTDGKWVGFFAGGKLKKVALAGGDALAICDVDIDTPGAGWGAANTILFSPGWNAPLHSVSADGGASVPVSTIDAANGELGHWWPETLPDEKTVLFTVWRAAAGINDARIALLDLTTGRHHTLMPGANAKYLTSGHLLFFHAGAYHVVGFDPKTERTTGDPRKVLEGAMPMDPNGTRAKPVAVSADGTMVYIARTIFPKRQLAWASRTGVLEELSFAPREFGASVLSPDGRRIAVSRSESGSYSLWLYDIARRTEDKLSIKGASFEPVWKGDGQGLAFTSMLAGHFDISTLQLDEAVDRPLIHEPFDQSPLAWTRDGSQLVLYDYFPDGTTGVTLADVARPKERRRLPAPGGAVHRLQLSPDDRWMALEMSGSGRREILVQRFPNGGPAIRVSPGGGSEAHWSLAGPVLYYRRENELVAVTYRDDAGRFAIDREERLFQIGKFQLLGVAPDGRFLIARNVSDDTERVQVVLNWFTDVVLN